jgi:protein-S-isoprenylcysteine O-methyltransferase Ste14
VRCGFALGALALFAAEPTELSLLFGLAAIVPGEALRLWAAGHLDKTQRLATGGPYGRIQHPLYLGSLAITLGVAIASAHLVVVLLAVAYTLVFFPHAHLEERQFLARTFGAKYEAWSAEVPSFVPRLLAAGPRDTRFSWRRVMRNGEWRTCLGAVVAVTILYLRARA